MLLPLLLSVVPPVGLLGLWAGEGAGAAAAAVDIFACSVDWWMDAIECMVLDWGWLDLIEESVGGPRQ